MGTEVEMSAKRSVNTESLAVRGFNNIWLRERL